LDYFFGFCQILKQKIGIFFYTIFLLVYGGLG
jgi:hypothetical protein